MAQLCTMYVRPTRCDDRRVYIEAGCTQATTTTQTQPQPQPNTRTHSTRTCAQQTNAKCVHLSAKLARRSRVTYFWRSFALLACMSQVSPECRPDPRPREIGGDGLRDGCPRRWSHPRFSCSGVSARGGRSVAGLVSPFREGRGKGMSTLRAAYRGTGIVVKCVAVNYSPSSFRHSPRMRPFQNGGDTVDAPNRVTANIWLLLSVVEYNHDWGWRHSHPP